MAVRNVDPFIEEIPYPNGLYRARVFQDTRVAVFPAHYHKTDLEIIIPTDMKGDFVCNGKRYEVDNYSICFIAPGIVHSNRFRAEGAASHFTLQINMKKFAALLAEYLKVNTDEACLFLSKIPPFINDRFGELRRLVFSLSQIGNTPTGLTVKGEPLQFLSDMGIIFSMMRSALLKAGSDAAPAVWQNSIRRILDVIGPLGLGATSLSEIAERSSLSKSHMCALFKKVTGGTIQNHILELRVQYASRLLNDKGYNVTEAAGESGFENLSHFVRVFKKLTGVTPKKWVLRK